MTGVGLVGIEVISWFGLGFNSLTPAGEGCLAVVRFRFSNGLLFWKIGLWGFPMGTVWEEGLENWADPEKLTSEPWSVTKLPASFPAEVAPPPAEGLRPWVADWKQFLESGTPGLPPPRWTFSTGVFGEGRLRSPEKERWEGAPERLIFALYKITCLKMCWKIGSLGSRQRNNFTNQYKRCES